MVSDDLFTLLNSYIAVMLSQIFQQLELKEAKDNIEYECKMSNYYITGSFWADFLPVCPY